MIEMHHLKNNVIFIQTILSFVLSKKVSGEIAFDLISLFHVQIQEPTSRSSTTRTFVFLAKFAEFYYHKIFCVDECNPCGLSITGDIKIYQCLTIKGNDITSPNREVLYQLLSQSCFYCPKLITGAPLELEIKRFVTWLWANVTTTTWGGVPNGTLSMKFTCHSVHWGINPPTSKTPSPLSCQAPLKLANCWSRPF